MTSEIESRTTQPQFATLRAFEAVGRFCGIRRAAQALQLDHAVVSRHLRWLEDWAGIPLVHRRYGLATLTEEGARYHARVSAALQEISNANVELLQRRESQTLSIWCVPGFACAWLASRLCLFQKEYPSIQVELHPTDTAPDFSSYEADIDIRYVALDPPVSAKNVVGGVRRFEIARPPVMAVATPGLLATLAPIRRPADLLRAPLLHESSPLHWQYWFQCHGIEVNRNLQGPLLGHAHVAIEVARRGQGVALANPFLLSDDLDAGRLVQVGSAAEDGCPVALGAYALATRADRWHATEVVNFRHWLKSLASKAMKNWAISAVRFPPESGRSQQKPVSIQA